MSNPDNNHGLPLNIKHYNPPDAASPTKSETGTLEKSSLIDLKNGKVILKQKPVSFEKQSETLQEIVGFREMLEEHIEKGLPPLTVIPVEHRPLIAKLAHESDKTTPALARHILQQVLPTDDDDDDDTRKAAAVKVLPQSVVEASIKSIMSRNNYGLDSSDGTKPPAAVCVWRWEVKDQHTDWLPEKAREKAEHRLAERVQAKKELATMFEELSEEERNKIFAGYKRSHAPAAAPAPIIIDLANSEPSLSQGSMPSKAEENISDLKEKVPKPKKPIDPEKAAKEKEKLERKAAKLEKEKAAKDAQNKSRSLMANFFTKPKASTSKASPAKATESPVAGPSKVQSDFAKTFKPFVLLKDHQLAPVNWFLAKANAGHEVIIIDEEDHDDDIHMQAPPVQVDVTGMNAKDRLHSILSSLPPPARPRRGARSLKDSHAKTNGGLAVRDLMTQLSEAEIAGDVNVVRSLLSKLTDRTLFPAKVMIFHEDARPGYFGTWTRSSQNVGPRTPFAKDVVELDYGYDSGEDWEEEPNEDADDVVADGEDDEGDADDQDSDMDDWLVDDDGDPGTPLEERMASPLLPDIPLPAIPKRKAEDAEKKLAKKRKVVVPLVPFAKGPCWESSIGECEYEPFRPYQMRLFNDSPFPLDPFTFVSTCDGKQVPSVVKAPPRVPADAIFVVPSVPVRVSNTTDAVALTGSPVASSSSAATTPAVAKKLPVRKAVFPEDHVPFLLSRITSLQAASLTYLVETIYQELRSHKVKKNAIDAKVREVTEKCKETKVWVVKRDVAAPS